MAHCFANRDARYTLALLTLLKRQFADIADNQPEVLARHCTEAGLIEKAVDCGARLDSGRSARSALVEADRATHARA